MQEQFERYCGVGWKTIPLMSSSKRPIYGNWHQNWTPEKVRLSFFNNVNLNIGLLLGEIVDVEGDSEEANKFLMRLIGNYPHPIYQSNKSVHHLFLNSDPNLTRLCYQQIEFRAYQHQSVLPPSKVDGSTYFWLDECGLKTPIMPASLVDFLKSIRQKKTLVVKKSRKPNRTFPWCSVCQKRFYLHIKRYRLEQQAFQQLKKLWSCQDCRTVDVRPICRQLRKRS